MCIHMYVYDFRDIDYKAWHTLQNYRHLGILFWADYNRIIQFAEFHSQHATHTHIFTQNNWTISKTTPCNESNKWYSIWAFWFCSSSISRGTIHITQTHPNRKITQKLSQSEMWNLKSKRTNGEAVDVEKNEIEVMTCDSHSPRLLQKFRFSAIDEEINW